MYEPPKAEILNKTTSQTAKTPILAYLLAVISGLFVTFGILVFVAFSHLFIGHWIISAPLPVRWAIPPVAIGLGVVSAWQSLLRAKRKANEKLEKQLAKERAETSSPQ